MRCDRYKEGFTLIEVVMSIVILLIGVSASLLAITTGLKRASAAENKMQSLHEARQHMETLRMGTVGFDSPYLREGNYPSSSLGFSYSVAEDPSNDNLKTITIRAPWYDPVRSITATTEVVTLFSRALH